MPVDFSNAQSVIYWGAAASDDTTASTEQPSQTPEQIAEQKHQDQLGVGLFCIVLVWLVGLVILGEKKVR